MATPPTKVMQSATKHTDIWNGTRRNKTQATRNAELSLWHDVTPNTDWKTKQQELSVTNWSLWWAAAKAKLCFGFYLGEGVCVRGTAINTDRVRLLCRRQHTQVREFETLHRRFVAGSRRLSASD